LMSQRIPGGFVLVPIPPRLVEYQQLRALARLEPKTDPQAAGALRGSWAVCHVRAPGGGVVAMGRVIGDGGWHFTLADVVAHPGYRDRELADRVLDWLVSQVADRAPADPCVTVITDAHGRGLYERVGFGVMGRFGPGMHMVLEQP
jgi:ribosomal protein S18 acetylase RimI-like enzyme